MYNIVNTVEGHVQYTCVYNIVNTIEGHVQYTCVYNIVNTIEGHVQYTCMYNIVNTIEGHVKYTCVYNIPPLSLSQTRRFPLVSLVAVGYIVELHNIMLLQVKERHFYRELLNITSEQQCKTIDKIDLT